MRTAMCACGQLEVHVSGEPVTVRVCNCAQCQRRTGSPFGLSSYWEPSQVQEFKGQSKTFRRISDAGRSMEFHFCPDCGGTVYWFAEVVAPKVGIAGGCFADSQFPPPEAVAYAPQKHDWVVFPEGVRLYPTTSIHEL